MRDPVKAISGSSEHKCTPLLARDFSPDCCVYSFGGVFKPFADRSLPGSFLVAGDCFLLLGKTHQDPYLGYSFQQPPEAPCCTKSAMARKFRKKRSAWRGVPIFKKGVNLLLCEYHHGFCFGLHCFLFFVAFCGLNEPQTNPSLSRV